MGPLMWLAGPVALLAAPLAHAAPIPLPLDHDLFLPPSAPASPLPFFRGVWAAPASPVPLSLDPTASPDALLLRGPGPAPAPTTVTVPAAVTGDVLYLVVAAQGPLEVRDIAMDTTLAFSDGSSQKVKWLVGETISPAWAGVSGRNAQPLCVGQSVGGDTLCASLLTVELSSPAHLDSVTFAPRGGPLSLALLAASLEPGPPVTQARPSLPWQPRDWYAFPIPAEGGLSGLLPPPPAPAGTHGRVRVSGDALGFEDGTPATFWGVNLVGESALPPKEQAPVIARALAKQGFNLARLHHIDGEGGLLHPQRGAPGAPVVRPEMLDRLDWMVASLIREGIYVFVEGWTLRPFRVEEGVPSPGGLAPGNKYALYVWPAWQAAWRQWMGLLYDRENPYTGRRYADEPGIAVWEASNEHALVAGWSAGALEKLAAPHRQQLDALWTAWLRRTYGSDAAIQAAWVGAMRSGLQAGESVEIGSVAREPSSRGRTDLYPTQRAADLVRFYQSIEAAWQGEMVAALRGFGVTAPIVSTTSLNVPWASAQLGPPTGGDLIDLHLYWDNPAEQTSFHDQSLVLSPWQGRLSERFSECQSGLPCFLSELNHAYPNRFSLEAPLWWSAVSARQGLSGLAWFAWSHRAWEAVPSGPEGSFDLGGKLDWMAQIPLAGRLFREIPAAPAARVRWWSPKGLLRELAEPSSLPLEGLSAWGSVTEARLRSSFGPTPPPMPAVAWPPAGAGVGAGVGGGPLRWSPLGGAFVAEGATVQAVVGRPGAAVVPSMLRPSLTGFAAVWLAALDGAPLGRARAGLVVVTGRSERAGSRRWEESPGMAVWGGGAPMLERLHGRVALWWPVKPSLWVLGPDGQAIARWPVRRMASAPPRPAGAEGRGGWWEFSVEGLESPWLRLEPGR